MVAADTSAWISFFSNDESDESRNIEAGLREGRLVLAPLVLFELLSSPTITDDTVTLIKSLPRIDLTPGFWERAGEMRRQILKKKLKSRTADCLIAQSCIDAGVPLIAVDSDFRHYQSFGLKLV